MEIADWRKKIDALDEQIVKLLNERAACAVAIGDIKRQNGAAIYEPQREQQVIAHARNANPGPLAGEQVQDIYERIMDVMRSLQRPDHGVPPSHQQQPVAGSKS
jgi:chorismate mutase/prephenate dehydratase